MPSLYDVYYNTEDENSLGGIQTNTLDEYFKTPNFMEPDAIPDYNQFDVKQDVQVREKRNALIDMVGQGLWSFADEAAFGTLAPASNYLFGKELEENYLTPQTIPGKVGSAIGGTLGFIWGAPMKVGAKATSLLAKPIIKKVGAETVDQIVKKTSATIFKEGGTKTAKNLVDKTIKKRLIHTAHTARFTEAAKGVATNWGESASKAIKEVVKGGVIKGDITPKQARLIREQFDKNIGTRPMQDFVDLMMKRHPNKFGFVVGSMIQEGVMFGLIDAAMEVSHSIHDDRPYDFTAPLWGVGVGAAFGTLKLLPAAGKSSITSDDFMAGVKTLFSKPRYKGLSETELKKHSELIGKSLQLNGESSIISYKGMEINLQDPMSNILTHVGGNKAKATEVLRAALEGQKRKYGRDMMLAAVTEDFQSTLANWPRVIAGTAIMNARTMIDLSKGYEMPAEDIATSLLIGAFINRKGRPLTPDMNMQKMSALRRGLHVHGTPQTHMYDLYPTLSEDQFASINPLTNPAFKELRDKARELGIIGENNEDLVISTKDGSPTIGASKVDRPLFNEFMKWIAGASGELSVKPTAQITEKEMIEIERVIKKVSFGTKKIKTLQDFKDIMRESTEELTDSLERELGHSLREILNNSTDNWSLNDPSSGSLGTLPELVTINQRLLDAIIKGEYKGLEIETVLKAQQSTNKLIEINNGIMKGEITSNPAEWHAELTSEAQVRSMVEQVRLGEQRVNEKFNTGKKSLNFTFNEMDHYTVPLMIRHGHKSMDLISEFFDDTKNEKFGELRSRLVDVGIIKPRADRKDATKEDLPLFDLLSFHNVEIDKGELDYKGGNEEALLKSVIGILATKGNKSINVNTTDKVTIKVEKIHELNEYLNANKINTQKEILDMFRANITQRITSEIIKNTEITNNDVAILADLSGLELPFANYSTTVDGGTGFSVRKIDLSILDGRTTHYKLAKRYNDYIYNLIKRATYEGKSFINLDESIMDFDGAITTTVSDRVTRRGIRVSKQEAIGLDTIIRKSEAKQQQQAQETLIDFIATLNGADPLKHGLVQWVENAERPNDLLFNMISKGLITTNKRQNTLEYIINKDFLTDTGELKAEVRSELQEWLQKSGVYMSDIENKISSADIDLDVRSKFKDHSSAMTQQGFFEKYFPLERGMGSKYQEAVEQNDLIEKALYNPTTKDVNENPHERLIEQMEFTIGGNKVTGSEVVSNPNYQAEYIRASRDVQKIFILRKGTISKPELSVNRGDPVSKMKNQQRSPFTDLLDESGIPYVFVNGESFTHYFKGGKVKSASLNVLDYDSSVSTDRRGKQFAKAQQEHFYDTIKRYTWDKATGDHKGMAIIRMGNAKNPIGVPESSFKEVAELYREKIFKPYYKKDMKNPQGSRLKEMMDNLDKTKDWSAVHEDAMRSIIINDMLVSKVQGRFLETLTMNSLDLAEMAKRVSLFHTPSFRRMDGDLLVALRKSLTNVSDMNLLRSFENRDLGYIVWNDKDHAKVSTRNEEALKFRGTSWKKMLGGRNDESSYDSISFISKDYADFLNLYYGTTGAAVFKPIVSSNGEGNDMMYAKTVFVYDPHIQSEIFGKSKNLDMIITRSADKMKSAISETEWLNTNKPDRPRYIDKTVDQMIKIEGSEIDRFIRTIPKDKVGISIIPEAEMPARQSYSIPNYMESIEAGEYYNAFYKNRLDKLLVDGTMAKFVEDGLYKRLALLKLKKIDPRTTLEDMQNSPEGLENLGHHMQIAAMGGDVRMLGEGVLIDAVKSHFLDPIMSPPSIMGGNAYGGKSVLKQNFEFRDLKPTVRTGEKEDTKIFHGDIMLPAFTAEGSVDFSGKSKDLELRIVDNNGGVFPLKKKLEDMYKAYDAQLKKKGDKLELSFKDFWEKTTIDGNLGLLHSKIEVLNKALGEDLAIGIMTTRYPRTTPNDLAILRLKGFLGKDHGNTAIANDFDVLNIFEGDYDVDEIDFFWGMNRGTWKHNQRVQRHWVNTVNTDHYEGKVPELSLSNSGRENAGWNTFDGNNRVLKKGIGLVQKTVRLVNHLSELGTTNETTGRKDLLKYTHGENEFTVSVDYDNASFFERSALESQLIIDYWKGVDQRIVNKMMDWRNDYLFPIMDKSVSQNDIQNLAEQKTAQSVKGPQNSRIRLFRKFDQNGKEHDLTAEERTIIKTLMSEHGRLLTLSTEVYDNTGQGSPAKYEDIMSITHAYFGHLEDMTSTIYKNVKAKHGDNELVKSMFKPDQKLRAKYNKTADKLYGKALEEYDAALMRERGDNKSSGKYMYRWWNDSPLIQGVMDKGIMTATSGGDHGSVVERIYREIMHNDPLGNNGKGNILLQGEGFKEMQAVANEIIYSKESFGEGNLTDRMREIIPQLTGKVNSDVKIIKYWKRQIGNIARNKEIPENLRKARIESLIELIKEKEAVLKGYLPDKYLKTGDAKYLEGIKFVDISRDKDMLEGTVQWYTLHELSQKFTTAGDVSNFYKEVTALKAETAQEYSEYFSAGTTSEYQEMTQINPEQQKKRMSTKKDPMEVEEYLALALNQGYGDHGMPFLLEYAMPTKAETTIGIYNGNPIAVSSKASGRFKRVVKFLLDKFNNETNHQEKNNLKLTIEHLTKRYSAYSNFFDGNFGLIPTNDQGILGIINNVPGYSRKLVNTWDRYESINTEKGVFNKDVFGMGPEYDTNIEFFRNLINTKLLNHKGPDYKKLETALSYTNQLMMQNNYLDPISYHLMQEGVRQKLTEMGLGKVITKGIGEEGVSEISGYSMSPELALMAGSSGGASIKPLALLSEYRLSMLRKFIKQGRDIKESQKSSGSVRDSFNEFNKAARVCPK